MLSEFLRAQIVETQSSFLTNLLPNLPYRWKQNGQSYLIRTLRCESTLREGPSSEKNLGKTANELSRGGWIRLSDSPDAIDAPLIATLSDCWPPAVFSWAKTRESIGDVPTIDLTIHFRRDPRKLKLDQNAFLLVRFETHTISEGYLVENGEIWTENGTLIAESRQLAVVG